jgi:hypothetical protein
MTEFGRSADDERAEIEIDEAGNPRLDPRWKVAIEARIARCGTKKARRARIGQLKKLETFDVASVLELIALREDMSIQAALNVLLPPVSAGSGGEPKMRSKSALLGRLLVDTEAGNSRVSRFEAKLGKGGHYLMRRLSLEDGSDLPVFWIAALSWIASTAGAEIYENWAVVAPLLFLKGASDGR